MDKSALDLFNLMFEKKDTVCVSKSKFGHHSTPLEMVLSGKTTLVSPNSNVPTKIVSSNDLIFVALNPIKGFRTDSGVYKFKNFLLELDEYGKDAQINYVKSLGIPYSAMVWSGSKSVHTLISLKESLPNEQIYRFIYKWMLNVASLCDQQLGNPSRSLRIPGAIRPETNNLQELIELKDSVNIDDLVTWLKKYPDSKPQERKKNEVSEDPETYYHKLSPWARKILKKGLDPTKSRNSQVYALAYDFALQRFSESDTIDYVMTIVTPEKDFDEKEIVTCVTSAFKHVEDKS